MKTAIHPEYVESHVRCTCGNEFTTRSTEPEIRVEICSNCHPVLHGPAEARRHRRPRRALQAPRRQARLPGLAPPPPDGRRRHAPARAGAHVRRAASRSATPPSAARPSSRAS